MVCEERPDGDGDGDGMEDGGHGGSRRQWVGGSKRPSALRLREGGRSTEKFDNGRASSVAAILGPFLCWPGLPAGARGWLPFQGCIH